MVCTGSACPRRNMCARFYQNVHDGKTHTLENIYSFGSGKIDSSGSEVTCACGEAGSWRMYKPMQFGYRSSVLVVDELI